MLRPYLKIWEWEWIFGRAVKAISSLGVRCPWFKARFQDMEGQLLFLNAQNNKNVGWVLPTFVSVWYKEAFEQPFNI